MWKEKKQTNQKNIKIIVSLQFKQFWLLSITKILYILQIQSSLMILFPQKNPKKKKNTKLNVMDHVKLSAFLSAQIPVAIILLLCFVLIRHLDLVLVIISNLALDFWLVVT